MRPKLIIVAALEREVAPLIPRDYRFATCGREGGREIRVIFHGDTLITVAGIGTMSARLGTQCAIGVAKEKVGLIISAGLAGALTTDLRVGDIFKPERIEGDGFPGPLYAVSGRGALVTSRNVEGQRSKELLARRFSADAVDMEAYAVADVARLHQVPFLAVKAISDDLEFPMPALNRFISERGEFRVGRFAFHTALRPWTWWNVARLARNSQFATQALCTELERIISGYAASGHYNGADA